MKTVKEIKSEIAECKKLIGEAESKSDRKSKTLAKKLRAELVKLNQYKLYLETTPTEESCRRAAQKVQDLINKITDDFMLQYGNSGKVYPAAKKTFLKERGVPKLKLQLSQLQYLLS